MNPLLEFAVKEMDGILRDRRTRLDSLHLAPDDVEELLDYTFQGAGGTPLGIDIFRTKNSDNSPLPVIIMIHGGGLVTGSRKTTRAFCENLAAKRFLVFVPDYRLATDTDVLTEIGDVYAAFSYVSDYLEGYGGDPDRVSVVSDSAGAFLATYAVATTESDALQEAFGLDELPLRINALVCFSGMFYTNQRGPLGLFYADALYGKKLTDPSFMQLMDPECPEVMGHLPPMFLVSSDADILKNYTKRYISALREAEHPCEFLYYRGNRELDHAFPTMKPYLTESQEVLEKLIDWLNQVDDEE